MNSKSFWNSSKHWDREKNSCMFYLKPWKSHDIHRKNSQKCASNLIFTLKAIIATNDRCMKRAPCSCTQPCLRLWNYAQKYCKQFIQRDVNIKTIWTFDWKIRFRSPHHCSSSFSSNRFHENRVYFIAVRIEKVIGS